MMTLSLVVAACQSSQSPCATPMGNMPMLVLGTGTQDGSDFASLTEGQRVPLTFGSQQGFHVWMNLRAHDVAYSRLTIKRTARYVDTGQQVSFNQEQLTLVPATDSQLAGECWGQLPASVPTFMCPNVDGLTIPGHPLEIDVEVTDTAGRTASDHHVIMPFCPQNTFEAACQAECAPVGPADAGVDG